MNVGSLWASLRTVLKDYFSFYDIKDVCSASGLEVERLSHLQQRSGSSTSKGNLLDAIDAIVNEMDTGSRDRFVAACIEEIITQNSRSRDRLEELLRRAGWGLSGKVPYPLELAVDIAFSDLPETTRNLLERALKRYRDGDIAGALTSICGMVDDITQSIYLSSSIGSFTEASYQERVSKAFSTLEITYRCHFSGALSDDNIKLLWDNQRKSVSQSGYVLGSFRRNFADVHGWNDTSREVAQSALNNAIYIIRCLLTYK